MFLPPAAGARPTLHGVGRALARVAGSPIPARSPLLVGTCLWGALVDFAAARAPGVRGATSLVPLPTSRDASLAALSALNHVASGSCSCDAFLLACRAGPSATRVPGPPKTAGCVTYVAEPCGRAASGRRRMVTRVCLAPAPSSDATADSGPVTGAATAAATAVAAAAAAAADGAAAAAVNDA